MLTPCRCNPACPALHLFPITAPSFPAHSAVWLALFAAGLGPLGRRWCGCSAGPRRGALGSLQSPFVAESTAVSARPALGWLPIASHRLRHSTALWLAGRGGRSKQSRGLGISLAPLHPIPCPSADPRVSSLFFLYSVLPAPISCCHACPPDGFSCQPPSRMTQTTAHPIRTALSREEQA